MSEYGPALTVAEHVQRALSCCYGDEAGRLVFARIIAAVRAGVANEIRTHAGPLNDRGIRVGVQDWSADRGQGYTSAIGEVLDLLAVDPLSPPEPRLPIPPVV